MTVKYVRYHEVACQGRKKNVIHSSSTLILQYCSSPRYDYGLGFIHYTRTQTGGQVKHETGKEYGGMDEGM